MDGVVIRLLHATWAEICRDQERAVEFDQSSLFQKVYEEEFGTPGGRPYGLLIGVYDVQHRRTPDHLTDDVGALRGLAVIAAAAFAPLVLGATPVLLGLDSWSELGQPIDLASPFRHPDFARWQQLQAMEEARFLGIVVPRVLMRRPYGDEPSLRLGFRYRERPIAHDDHLWGSGVFAFAAVVVRAFGDYRWFADIRGVHPDGSGGGLITGLPRREFEADGPGVPGQAPVEAMLTETQDRISASSLSIPAVSVATSSSTATSRSSALGSTRKPRPTPAPSCRRCCNICFASAGSPITLKLWCGTASAR